LATSLAVAVAAANSKGAPLYEYIAEHFGEAADRKNTPIPMLNIINGGAHADNNLEIQEFMILPMEFSSFGERLRAGAEIYKSLKKLLTEGGYTTAIGDEGGFAPNLGSDEDALEIITRAIREAGYEGKVKLALDVASSEWYEGGKYLLEKRGEVKGTDELIAYLEDLTNRYPIISIEDGLSEDDYFGRMQRHLKVEWTLTDNVGGMDCEGMWKTVWQIFPGVPFIRKSLFARGAYQTYDKTGMGDAGVWYADDLASEALAFDRQTFVIDSVELHDHSDRSDDLVRTVRNYPYYDEFYQRYAGHFFFIQDRQAACLTLCKLAPCIESEINGAPWGLRTTHQGSAEIIGLGISTA
jgi:hypothetical protein